MSNGASAFIYVLVNGTKAYYTHKQLCIKKTNSNKLNGFFSYPNKISKSSATSVLCLFCQKETEAVISVRRFAQMGYSAQEYPA